MCSGTSFYAKTIGIMLNSVSMIVTPSRALDGGGLFETKTIQQEIDQSFHDGGWVIPGLVEEKR